MLLTLVIACFVLSGFAALLYQVVWMRLFAIAFGTSEIAVAIVLAGYMAGLAIGAAVAARYVNRITRPVLVYGVLEGAIALAALALPFLVDVSGQLYAYFVGGQPAPPDASTFGQSLYYGIASFLVLLIPTALMGATLPMLARYAVTSDRNLGSRVSTLYSMNTFGAVGGTLVAGFVLLPALGLRGTMWVGVLVNGLVFILAIVLARYAGSLQDVSGSESVQKKTQQGSNFILPMILLSGVLSFVYEVLWTRMLSHVLGSSIYAFATMLSAFLTGIAIGAAAAGFVARNPWRAARIFAVCQFGIALASAFIYWRIEQSLPSSISYAAVAFAVILPSTIFIGATYPLAVRAYAGNVADVGRASAIVYSWNTVGAIVGAIGGGFFIIPMLGFAGTAQLAVISNVLLGLAVLALCARQPSWPALPRWQLAGGVVLLIGLTAAFQPQRPDEIVTRGIFGGSGERLVREVHYSVGRSSTVLMTENQARFDLSTNGLPEAQIEFKGSPPRLLSQRWLGMWPVLARPEADSILVVGLGGGVVLEGVPASIGNLLVV
jgi:spermidine synthase